MKECPSTNREAGTTIAEMLVTCAVFVMCMGVALAAFMAAFRLFYFTRMLDYAHNEVKGTVDQISLNVRESISFPIVLTNGVQVTTPTEVIETQSGLPLYTNIVGTELRLLVDGFGTQVASSAAAGATTLIVKNNISNAPVAAIPTVWTNIGSNTTSVSSTMFRTTPVAYQIQAGDAYRVDSATVWGGNINSATISGSNITLQLSAGLPQALPVGTKVVIGREVRYVLTNSQLVYYPRSGSSSNSVLIDNVTTTNPFGVTGNLVTVDLRYTSRGDISGKGIYRIITRATVRTDPDFDSKSFFVSGGLNEEASGGTN